MSGRPPAIVLLALALGACDAGSSGPKPTSVQGSWLRYEGTFRYFVEHSEGAADCGTAFYYGQTSGFFGVTRNKESGATTLTWEGMGCELNVQGSDPGPFTATDAPCRVADDAGIRHFGIESIHFDDFTFDPEASELTARGRFGRVVDGQRTSYCFEAPDGR